VKGLPAVPLDLVSPALAAARASTFPRLRYMGSKYRLVPRLAEVFAEVGGATALDAFSGSGVVSYTLKALGYAVTASDFLSFPTVIASATIANQGVQLSAADVARVTGPAVDGRDFIQRTFDGLYFDADDRAFLDSAWSHIDLLTGEKRALAIAALILAAAKKQPRGVFTFTDLRYDDGRRDLHLPLREHFAEAVDAYNAVVFDSGAQCQVKHSDVAELDPAGYDLVYLDPPYAPPRDDNCYIKRYHFLEGLSVYWEGLKILEHTATKKLEKRYTPFSYKHTVSDALLTTFERFADSAIVLSYSSNAVPDAETIERLLRSVKKRVEVRSVDHRYHFGTHAQAQRRRVAEYIFVAR
jgi:DNA adenine methylase/adenine-specific DNA-methyltransferase